MKKGSKILSFLVTLFFILFNIFLISLTIIYGGEFRYRLSGIFFSPLREHVEALYIKDLEGDGDEDVASVYSEEPFPYRKILSVFNFFNFRSILRQDYFFEKLVSPEERPCAPEDLNGDGQLEIPVAKIQGNEIGLDILSIKGDLISSLHFLNPLPEGGFFNEVVFVDIDGDAIREMIGLYGTGWWARPRGVAAFRLTPPGLLWVYFMGGDPLSLEVEDIDDDGKKEIFIATFAPHNGVVANDTDDDHSYLISLDYRGKRIWQREMGWYFTRVYFTLEDMDGDGKKEIICSKSCHREYAAEPGELRLVDALTGETRKTLTARDFSYTDVHVFRNRANLPRIVVGASTGRVFVYDQELKEITSATFESPARVLKVGRLGSGLN